MKDKFKSIFKYLVLIVILFVPFIYSFFYLKAYWNPYGKGNIDNLPVAIVNDDEGSSGTKLVEGIKKSKKLKLYVVSNDKAEDGLYNGTYYAVIKIPSSFTSDALSASSNNKKHPTITYSPNQKSNYLASQIINTVVLNVEKNMDNEINSKIVEGLKENLEDVPNSLNKINDGFKKLSDGTTKLDEGSKKIVEGSNMLTDKYSLFDKGINELKNGSNTLSIGTNKLQKELSKKIDELNENLTDEEKQQIINQVLSNPNLSDVALENAAMNGLQLNSDYIKLKNKYNTYLNTYNESLSTLSTIIPGLTDEVVSSCLNNENANIYCQNNYVKQLVSSKKQLNSVLKIINGIENTAKQTAKQTANIVAKQTAISVAQEVKMSATSVSKESLNELLKYINEINAGVNKIDNGMISLSNGSSQIYDGVSNLNSANTTLNTGIKTLNNSVIDARGELLSKTSDTKKDLNKLDKLDKYSENPIKVKTKEVNKVNSYGTAFSPLFVCVGLWVGCLMMFMVLYYDKEERFGVFGINDDRLIKKTISYHTLITISSFLLGLTLNIFLDFNVTNYALYYLSFILIGNVFMALIEFLITNFKDFGKFIALILLILQLAASAGTFPIETVSKGFRWMNNYLPMTYAIRLLKECLIKIESNLITSPLIILLVLFIVFFTLNIIRDIKKQKKVS